MILLLDNYDSFTYNLYDYILQLGLPCTVIKNDELSIDELEGIEFDAAVISPGPKTPVDAGITMPFIKHFHKTKPILGICLGHQAIGEFFGWRLMRAIQPVHGKTSMITVESSSPLFKELPKQFEVMRYHSLVLEATKNTELDIVASTLNLKEIMALQHKTLPIAGLQFHPESILTPNGLQIMRNWFSSVL